MRAACLWLCLACSGCGSAAAQAQKDRLAVQRELGADVLLARGDAAASAGDTTRAEQYFVAALEAGADEKRLTERLLVNSVSDQRYPVAAEYAQRYLHHHPGDPEIGYAAASLYLALGDFQRARRLLESVVLARPHWPNPHFALASVLRDQGEALDAADRHDLEYLKLDPGGPLAELCRSRLRRMTP